MGNLENQLTAIGYRVGKRPACCWRVERVGPPLGERGRRAAAPMRSRALSRWLDRLCDRAPSAAYRIRPVGETN
jgi:hypothetical protein